jgi:GH15 family glucan-1,4-alpha-glucosidase
MPYQPLINYSIIGDLNTVALISIEGSIDFMCFPSFDSPSIFTALIDKEKGGSFSISPKKSGSTFKQMYLPDTNILFTRFLGKESVGEIIDHMPVEEINGGKKLIRRVTAVRGTMTFTMHCKPRFNYGQDKHKTQKSDKGIQFICKKDSKDTDNSFVLELKSETEI